MEREFVTARAAAVQLGVPESVIIDDVQEGMDGQLPALIGGRFGDAWIVYAWQLQGEHLDRHRARLADHSIVSTPTSAVVTE
jgi:hypothetical protein